VAKIPSPVAAGSSEASPVDPWVAVPKTLRTDLRAKKRTGTRRTRTPVHLDGGIEREPAHALYVVLPFRALREKDPFRALA
jgi:hypothetical protein